MFKMHTSYWEIAPKMYFVTLYYSFNICNKKDKEMLKYIMYINLLESESMQ